MGFTVMANGHVDGGAEPDLPAGGDGYPSDLKDSEWARREPMVPPLVRADGRTKPTSGAEAQLAVAVKEWRDAGRPS